MPSSMRDAETERAQRILHIVPAAVFAVFSGRGPWSLVGNRFPGAAERDAESMHGLSAAAGWEPVGDEAAAGLAETCSAHGEG